MSKIKKIFNSLILSFALLGCFGLGMALQFTNSSQQVAGAELTKYDKVTNSLPEFVKLSSTAKESKEDYVYLFSDRTQNFNLSIANEENNLVAGSWTFTNENGTKETAEGKNYAYIPTSPLNRPDDPTTTDKDESKTEFYYFDFSGSLSLYHDGSNENILSGEDLSYFAKPYFASDKDKAFPVITKDFTPKKFEIGFRLDKTATSVVDGSTDATTASIVNLKDEGSYTLGVTISAYHTTDGGQTFSQVTDTYYYNFFVFDYESYFDINSNLPLTSMANAQMSTLITSDSHSLYYFYNYSTTALPAFSYNPRTEQLTINYTDTNNNAYETTIEFDQATKTITQKNEKGEIIDEKYVMASYDAATEKVVLTFNDLGQYDFSFDFIYVTNQNKVYDLPLTTKRQRLHNFGYQAFYTDYSKIDPATGSTLPQEFKKIDDKKSFSNSADITYAINAPDQHLSGNYAIDTIKGNALNAINEKGIKPVSTNQTPVRFISNANLATVTDEDNQTHANAKKYVVEFDSNNNAKIKLNSENKEIVEIFDGSNINNNDTSTTYLIIIDYTYSQFYSKEGTLQAATAHHYQAFYFTVENITSSATVIDVKGNEIRTKGYTNKDVYVIDDSANTLFDANVTIKLSAFNFAGKAYFEDVNIKTFITPQYGIQYFNGDMEVPEKYIDADSNESTRTIYQTGIKIDSSYRNAQYIIKIYSNNSKIPSTRSFTIDTAQIDNLVAHNVRASSSANYLVETQVGDHKTNQSVIFSWDEKDSGAKTYGYVKYYSLDYAQFYHTNADDSFLIYSLLERDLLPVNAKLNLKASQAGWREYANAKSYTNVVPATYARSQAGLYLVEVYDEAGNAAFDYFLVDNTSPLFVKHINPTLEATGDTSERYSILSTNDTITVSPEYTATICWASYKGIYISRDIDADIRKSYEEDGQEKDGNGNNTALSKLIDKLFSENTQTLTNLTGNPTDTNVIHSYNAQYLKIKVSDNYYFSQKTEDRNMDGYEAKPGKAYTIDFFLDENTAREGNYKFLLQDASNWQYSDRADAQSSEPYRFLNYPSNYLTVNVTSDASKVEVNFGSDAEGYKPVDKEGYSLRGYYYKIDDENKIDETNPKYIKNDKDSYTKSDLTYRYAYYSPVKAETTLTVTFIPVSRTRNIVSRVQSVVVEYYPFVTKPKEITINDSKFTAYYYTLSDTPTKSIKFEYSDSEAYKEGELRKIPLTFAGSGNTESGTAITSEGKYVITRKYFENIKEIDTFDYYERTLTLIVDRYNVLTVQEPVTGETADGKQHTSLESIVGGDMLVTMYSGKEQSSIQVAFPYYNVDTGLNSGSLFTKNMLDEDPTKCNISTKFTTNKLPLEVKIPKFKYTENYTYDSETNSYTAIENNTLSRLGNAEIKNVVESGKVVAYEIWVEGVLVKTVYDEKEANAYLNGTEMSQYRLYSVITYKSKDGKTTKYYKTNGSDVGGYLNYFELVTSNDIQSAVNSNKKVDYFKEAGTYYVTIYQAYNAGNGENSFKDFYHFSFEIESSQANFTVLAGEENQVELNSHKSAGDIETYYTNSKTVVLQWVDSEDRYTANIDKNEIYIKGAKWEGDILVNGTKWDRESDPTGANTKGVNTITLDLGEDGLNIWSQGSSFEVEMRYEGHDNEVHGQPTKKRIQVDYRAPLDNLNSLMQNVEIATGVLTQNFQQAFTRKLRGYDNQEITFQRLDNVNTDNVSYSYPCLSGTFKSYAYNVTIDYFDNLETSSDPTKVQEIYFKQIGDKDAYYSYVPTDARRFSAYGYTNITQLKDYPQLAPKSNNYYEIVEKDYAGNMTVYVVYIYDAAKINDEEGEAENRGSIIPTYDELNAENIALAYTNNTIGGDSQNIVFDKDIFEGGNIYSDSGFKLTKLNYLCDDWATYSFTINGRQYIYMKSPWLMQKIETSPAGQEVLTYDPDSTRIYSLTGNYVFTPTSLSDIFAGVRSSSRKHKLTLSNRFEGNAKNISISLMDASFQTRKYSSSTTATLEISVPTASQSSDPDYAYLFPTNIKLLFDQDERPVLEAENLSGDPALWQDTNEVSFDYIGGYLRITVSLGTNNSKKLKYVIRDNFGKTTNIIQIANEEIIDEDDKVTPIDRFTKLYKQEEPDGSTTFLSSKALTYRYNNILFAAKVFKYDGEKFVEIDSAAYGANNIDAGTESKPSISYITFNGVNQVYRVVLCDSDENATIIETLNIRVYDKLPNLSTSSPHEPNSIWFHDKNDKLITEVGSKENETVFMNGKFYTATATTISTFSEIVTVYFTNGQVESADPTYNYLKQYNYSVYISSDNGQTWFNINEYYSSGYPISPSGNDYKYADFKILIIYDDEKVLTDECRLFNLTINNASKVHYTVSVDGVPAPKATFNYTTPEGETISNNFIVSARKERVTVKDKDDKDLTPYRTIDTETNVSVEIYHYTDENVYEVFAVIYIEEPTTSLLSTLYYEDTSGYQTPLLGVARPDPIVAEESDFSRLKITWSGFYGIKENKINIEVRKLFDGQFVPVEMEVFTDGDNCYTYLTRAGSYQISFGDSSIPTNYQKFGTSNTLNLVFLNYVPFTVTYTDPETNEEKLTEPISRAIYNGEVKLSLVSPSSYFPPTGFPVIEVSKDGAPYTGFTTSNYVYTFKEPGYYSVRFSATTAKGEIVRQEEYTFTIINPNESRYAYEFAPFGAYYIEKVMKDGRDITADLVNLAGGDITMINGEKKLSKLLVSYFDEKTGNGRYVVTINTGEQAYSRVSATEFTFAFWINLATPPVSVSIEEGSTSTSDIALTFNAYRLHDTVGDCYIKISSDRYDINADTLDSIGGENAKITITRAGTYYIQIYTESGNLLYSYKVIKKDPLNTWAIIAIVIGILAVIAVTFITIKLRKRLKVK